MDEFNKTDNNEECKDERTEEIIEVDTEMVDEVKSVENCIQNNMDVTTTVEPTQEESTPDEPTQVSTTDEPTQDEPTQEEPTTDEPTQDKPKKMKKSFIKTHRTSLLLSGCFLLAIVGGFGGTMAAVQLSGSNKTVLYQSTNTDKAVGTSTTGNKKTIKEVSNLVSNSVVEIKTESVATNNFFPQAITSGAGSGVILSKDGYIVTNNHVISDASKITVTTKDGKSYEAKLIGTDSSTDLAIIKIEAKNLTPALLGTSSKLEVGDTAIAIGNPLGSLGGTVTTGIISALDREMTVDNQTMHLLQTNAAINPGNSGGGLFNDAGELIGIVNAKSSGTGIEGLGFAIPIDRAKDVITNLIENGYVKGRASLGVTLSTASSNNPFGNDGNVAQSSQVFISEIDAGKAADKAGLKVGDQILKADETSVKSLSDVKTVVNSHKAGDTMTITVLRDNETKAIKVTLGEASSTMNETPSFDK